MVTPNQGEHAREGRTHRFAPTFIFMEYDPPHGHRPSIRLSGYDYSLPGAYFITICSQNRKYLFGDIVGGEMQLNDAGRMVCGWYGELETKFHDMQCDEFVCMPNHVHFIIKNVGANLCVRPGYVSPPNPCNNDLGQGEHKWMGKNAGMDEHVGANLRVRPYLTRHPSMVTV